MQRDHYLPLKVIREHLDALERGEQVPLPAAGRPAGPSRTAAGRRRRSGPTAARIGRAELLAAAEVGEAELAEWESYGLHRAAAGRRLRRRGGHRGQACRGSGPFGLEPRHLRAMKAAADREAGLVEQVVAPLRRHRNPQTRAHAEATREGARGAVRAAARGAGADRAAGSGCTDRSGPDGVPDYPNRAGHVLGLLCERARRRGCPGGNALQPTDRAPA